jgi:hypothetical protein
MAFISSFKGLNAPILAVLILWVWEIHSLVINTIARVLEADFLKLNDNSIGEAFDKAPVALCLLLLKLPWRSLAQKQFESYDLVDLFKLASNYGVVFYFRI